MTAKIFPSSKFNLVFNELTEIPDWHRYDDAIRKGVMEALEKKGVGYNFQIEIEINEISGDTPPLGFTECARDVINLINFKQYNNGT